MDRDEINIALDWAANEGWNPGLNDADCFYAIDKDAFFIGKQDENVVACGAAFVYDDEFAFCGFYIVDERFRGQGYGLELTKKRLEYVADRNVGLDGVIDMANKYARLGYKTAHHSTRHEYTPTSRFDVDSGIVNISEISTDSLHNYDRKHFPADRRSFLEAWISQDNAEGLCISNNDKLEGYGVIRKCRVGSKIGPLFADSPEHAEALFRALCNHSVGEPVYLDIPEPNKSALALAEKYQMSTVFSCARMYIKGDPGLPLNNIYGITTFEAG